MGRTKIKSFSMWVRKARISFSKEAHSCETATMSLANTPKPYEEWRTNPIDRAEDAAYTFGFHLMQHCRREALKKIQSGPVPATSEEFHAQVSAAVDTALHNVMDLLGGFLAYRDWQKPHS